MDALYKVGNRDKVLAGLSDSINADPAGADPYVLLNGVEDELLRFKLAWRTLKNALGVIVDARVTESDFHGALDLATLANITCHIYVDADGDPSKSKDALLWVGGRLRHVMCEKAYIRLHAPQTLAQTSVIGVSNMDDLFHVVTVSATQNAVAELLLPAK